MAATAVTVMVGCLAAWFATHQPLPRKIRIATGKETGLYHEFGKALELPLRIRSGRIVELRTTEGSQSNSQLLGRDEVDLALLQAGFLDSHEFRIVAPLYAEALHVIVRKGRGIETTVDLAGRNVALGPIGSGMRAGAKRFLRHCGIDPDGLKQNDRYFADLAGDTSLDAAIVISGFRNHDLEAVLSSGQFELLPIDNAEAVAAKDPHLRPFTIARGLFAETPVVPDQPVMTLATTALLVVRKSTPDVLVDATLRSIYEDGLGLKFPMLIPRRQIDDWTPIPLHPASYEYFYPEDRIGWFANVMESLAATKELLFAMGAGLYLLWIRWQSLKERERLEHLQAQKDRLDMFLKETLEVELIQMKTSDPAKLRQLLDEVTQIKLRALRELTEEELRGDTTFPIFLMQCSDLSNNIQLKILNHNSP